MPEDRVAETLRLSAARLHFAADRLADAYPYQATECDALARTLERLMGDRMDVALDRPAPG